jgi:hypothetical protein
VLSRTIRRVANSIRVDSNRSPLTRRRSGAGCRHPHLVQRLPDRGQRRRGPLRERQVVKTDHAQIARNRRPVPARRLVHPGRLLVTAGEDGRRPGVEVVAVLLAERPGDVRVLPTDDGA